MDERTSRPECLECGDELRTGRWVRFPEEWVATCIGCGKRFMVEEEADGRKPLFYIRPYEEFPE